jgi:hypothetical protein
VSVEEVRCRGEGYLAGVAAGDRRETMTRVFTDYLDGDSVAKVAKSVGVSQSTVSLYLNAIEEEAACKIVRRPRGVAEAVKGDGSVLRAERTKGLRRASVRDFHSLRVTWGTLALTAGVPLELVQRVTGHKTTDVVLKHYFRPGQEDFRLALEGAMPKLLTQPSLRSFGAAGPAQSLTGGSGAAVKTANPPSPECSGAPREEMRDLINEVKRKALRERMLKVWAKW